MSAAYLKYSLDVKLVDATLVAVRRLSQLQENIRIWKGEGKLTEKEREALAGGQGYAIPRPE